MNQLEDLQETVVDASPYSFVVLGVAAAALILGVVACVLGHRRRIWKGLPGQLAMAAGSLVLLASGFVVAAAQAQRSSVIYQSTLPWESTLRDSRMVNLAIRVQFAGSVFLGGLMLLALTMVTLGLTLSWRTETIRAHRSLAMSRLRAVALLLPVWPPAAGLLLYGLRMNKGFWDVAWVDPSMKSAALFRWMDGAYPIVAAARAGLLLVVAVGAITAVVAWRRGALGPVSSVRLASSVLVFLAGLSAFTVTRGHAADRRPLPVLPHGVGASYASRVPSVSPCPPAEPAPFLEFRDDFVRLNGSPYAPDDEFRDHLVTLRNNYGLLHGTDRPMPYLIVEAAPATPIDRIIPYLQKLTEDTTILLASASPHPSLSKTLGMIPRYEFCGRTFRVLFEQTATPLSRYRNWSDVAATVSRNSEILQVAPW